MGRFWEWKCTPAHTHTASPLSHSVALPVLSAPSQYQHELRTVHVSEQLTPEALMSRLQAQRLAPPLLLHTSLWEVTVRGRDGERSAALPISLLSLSLLVFTVVTPVTPAAPHFSPPQSPGTTATKIETLIKASVKNIVNVRKYTNDNPLEVREPNCWLKLRELEIKSIFVC